MAYFHKKLERNIKFGKPNYIWTNFIKIFFLKKAIFDPPKAYLKFEKL